MDDLLKKDNFGLEWNLVIFVSFSAYFFGAGVVDSPLFVH